jgi:hypothetical protein
MNDQTVAAYPAASERDDLEILLEMLASTRFDGKAGNKALREELSWTSDADVERYWKARGRAIDSGKALSGKGKGGSIRLATFEVETATEVAPDTPAAGDASTQTTDGLERSLYAPAKTVIEQSWVREEFFDDQVVAITASRGRARTGGKWSRPDISVLAVKAFPYLPTRSFEIVTFEIKPSGNATVEAIFEALSHQQFATRSYALYVVEGPEFADNFVEKHQDGLRILNTARQHGVGVIVASNAGDWETWEELLAPRRVIPDPEQANRFIATCFPENDREQVIKWHK